MPMLNQRGARQAGYGKGFAAKAYGKYTKKVERRRLLLR
jgi:hypothetical protein